MCLNEQIFRSNTKKTEASINYSKPFVNYDTIVAVLDLSWLY